MLAQQGSAMERPGAEAQLRLAKQLTTRLTSANQAAVCGEKKARRPFVCENEGRHASLNDS